MRYLTGQPATERRGLEGPIIRPTCGLRQGDDPGLKDSPLAIPPSGNSSAGQTPDLIRNCTRLFPWRRGVFFSAGARVMFALNRLLMRRLFHLKTKGGEHLPEDSQFILAPNHVSYLDPFVLAAALSYRCLDRTYWAALADAINHNPLNRLIAGLAQAVPINPRRAAISNLSVGAAVLQSGHNLVWFPEGTRSPTGDLLPFKPGIGMLLKRFRIPVVPVYIRGTGRALPPGQLLPRFEKVTVFFGQPFYPEMLEFGGGTEREYDRIARAVRDRVKELGRKSR